MAPHKLHYSSQLTPVGLCSSWSETAASRLQHSLLGTLIDQPQQVTKQILLPLLAGSGIVRLLNVDTCRNIDAFMECTSKMQITTSPMCAVKFQSDNKVSSDGHFCESSNGLLQRGELVSWPTFHQIHEHPISSRWSVANPGHYMEHRLLELLLRAMQITGCRTLTPSKPPYQQHPCVLAALSKPYAVIYCWLQELLAASG